MIVLQILAYILLSIWALHRVFYYILREPGDTFWRILRRYYKPGPYSFLVILDIVVQVYTIVSVARLILQIWRQY